MTKPAANGQAPLPLIIAGAGIGGLTAALAIANKGIDVKLFEHAPELSEVGAGLQLSPNATRVLDSIGVLEPLRTAATPVKSIDLASAASGQTLLSLPTAKSAGASRSPYLAVHRADLQSALLTKVMKSPRIELQTGHVFEDARQDEMGVETEFMANGRVARFEGSALVGADGVWSQVRNFVSGANGAAHSGYMAWRTTISVNEQLPPAILSAIKDNRVVAFLAPGAHLVTYPLRNSSLINIVLITPGSDTPRGYDNPVDLTLMQTVIGQFDKPIGTLLCGIDNWRSWPLNYVAPGGAWVDRRIALIGDAAHAMTPFAAQGAAMAIEDAAVLANMLATRSDNIPAALAAFDQNRRDRICKVVARGKFNRFAYHLSGPAALARNMVFKLRGEALLKQLDWLFGFDVFA